MSYIVYVKLIIIKTYTKNKKNVNEIISDELKGLNESELMSMINVGKKLVEECKEIEIYNVVKKSVQLNIELIERRLNEIRINK